MNTKAASERYQRQVLELSKQPGNETCADCGGRYPRWASWNLGIFLCVNCAGVHRKMGTHISKIKSLTLDTWTKEQVEKIREGGNTKNNLKYNPDERRNRPPANVDEGERNSELERFIFDKYKGRFMDKKPPPVPSKDSSSGAYLTTDRAYRSSQPANGPTPRSRTAPIPSSSWTEAREGKPALPSPSLTQPGSAIAPALPTRHIPSTDSLGVPSSVPPRSTSATAASSNNPPHTQGPSATAPSASSSVFDDLLSLNSGTSYQPPLQMQPTSFQPQNLENPWAMLGTQQQAIISPMMMNTTSSASYFNPQIPSAPPMPAAGQHAFFANGAERSASLGNMAFQTAAANHFTGSAGNPFLGSAGANAHLMGQAAFGQDQHLHQQQQAFLHQQNQYPSNTTPVTPQSAPFGAFASTMMPSGQQQAPTFPSSWQPASSTQNMWH